MKYDVYVASTGAGERVGVEIQPPILPDVFNGIRNILTHRAYGPLAPYPCLAELTRDDTEGTAFTFGYELSGRVGESNVSVELTDVAMAVAGLLDPAGLHEIVLHYSET